MNEETRGQTQARHPTVRCIPVGLPPFIWKQWTGDPPAWERYRTEGPTQIDFSSERYWSHTDQDDNIICVNRYPTLVESLLGP